MSLAFLYRGTFFGKRAPDKGQNISRDGKGGWGIVILNRWIGEYNKSTSIRAAGGGVDGKNVREGFGMSSAVPTQLYNVFFSTTGGTQKAADLLASAFKPKTVVNLPQVSPRSRHKQHEFSDTDFVMVSCPTFIGMMPKVKGLFSNLTGNNTPCVVVATFGNRAQDNLAKQLSAQLERQGFIVIGAIAPVIPHVSSPKMGAGRPNEDDQRIFQEFADKVVAKLSNSSAPYAGLSVYEELPGDPEPEGHPVEPTPRVHVEEACHWCMSCIDACPVACIHPKTYEVVYDRCISCRRCAYVCRYGAWVFDGSKTQKWLEDNFLEPKPVEYWV